VEKPALRYDGMCCDVVCCSVDRMAPEVIACDEDPDATYDNRVSVDVTSRL